MRKFVLFFLIVCLNLSGLAQNKKKEIEVEIVSHQVQLGESIRMISRKYLVDPAEIYKLNKFAVDGISQGMVLQIPVPVKNKPVEEEKEVLAPKPIESTGIAEQTNAEQTNNEKPIEKKIEIVEEKPLETKVETIKEEPVNEIVRSSETNHVVEAKETLYSISRKFNIPVDDIKSRNKGLLLNGLKVGQVIIIPTSNSVNNIEVSKEKEIKTTEVVENKPTIEKEENKTVQKTDEQPAKTTVTLENINENSTTVVERTSEINHTVESKETLFSLSKKYNISVDDLKSVNQELLKNGLKIGQVIKIPAKGNVSNFNAEPIQKVSKSTVVKHKVEPKETLFSLSKKYNVTVDEIKQQNETILQNGLQIGQILIIKQSN